MSGTTGAAGVQQALLPLLSAYSVAELVYFVQNAKTAQTFLLDNFFPNIVESDAPEVAIDVDVGKRRMSPFCSPWSRGKWWKVAGGRPTCSSLLTLKTGVIQIC